MAQNLKYNNAFKVPFMCSLEINWWVFGVRGLISTILGTLAILKPASTIIILTVIFGAYALVDGVFSIISGINKAQKKYRWAGLVFSGILGLLTGLITLTIPHIVFISLTFFLMTSFAFWAISTGIFEIITAIRLAREVPGELLLGASGVLSVILGVFMLFLVSIDLLVSAATIGLIIGFNAVAEGVLLLLLAFKLRQLKRA